MEELLIDYIQKQLLGGRPGSDISPEDDLLGSGLIDSMGMMSLLTFIEAHYEIRIPPEDMIIDHFMNVCAIANYLKRRIQA